MLYSPLQRTRRIECVCRNGDNILKEFVESWMVLSWFYFSLIFRLTSKAYPSATSLFALKSTQYSQVEPCWGLFWSVCVFRAHPSYSPCVSTDELKARLQVKQRTAVVAGIVWDIWFTLLSMFWIHLTSEYYYFLVYANQLFGSAREYDLKSGSIRFNFKLAIQAFGSAWSDLFCVARLD